MKGYNQIAEIQKQRGFFQTTKRKRHRERKIRISEEFLEETMSAR